MNNYLNYISGLSGYTALSSIVTVAAAYYYYRSSKPIADKPIISLDQQSKIINNDNERIYTSTLQPEEFVAYETDDAQTLYETFRKGVQISNNKQCLGWRENLNSSYQWINYRDTLLKATNFGSGLIALGVKMYDFIGIYSKNCPEWILCELGVYTQSMVIVPLYDTLGTDACSYIIDNAKLSILIVEDEEKFKLILDSNNVPKCLKKIIYIKSTSISTIQRAKNIGIDAYSFDEIQELGAQNLVKDNPPIPNDICTICYTSGTTGNPKGVIITHRNLVANMAGSMKQLGKYSPNADDISISFLPLAHMIERLVTNAFLYVGGSIGFYSGDIKELPNDLKALRPTLMPIVPRLLNRVYDKIQSDISGSFIKRMLFNLALKSKESDLRQGIVRKNSLWDKLVFGKVQAAFGGNIRIMIVGSAPLASNVMTFARCAFGCMIVEGYGQTETTAPITITVPGDMITQHVGPPLPCCCIKLIDAPEMEYFAKDNKGEVCAKGTNIFPGYFHDPEKTAEVIDTDGWLHTGDIGMLLPNGTLRIIDRRKQIFKLSQGEYIVPEKIENIYIRSKYVEQVFVYGESLKSCVIAIVVPDEIVLKTYCSDVNYSFTNLEEMCKNEKIKKVIFNDMIKWGKEMGLKSFEQIKDIYLHSDLFSVKNEMLTATLKVRRLQLMKYFKLQLDDMYKHLN